MKRRKRRKNLELRLLDEWGRLDKHAASARGKSKTALQQRKARVGMILIQLQKRA